MITTKNKNMKDQREIRELRRNIRNMTLAGAGALGMFVYAGSVYHDSAGLDTSSSLTTQTEEFNIVEANMVKAVSPDILSFPLENERNDVTVDPGSVPSEVKKPKTVDEIQSFEVSCNNGSLVFNWITEGQGKYAYEIEKTTENGSFEVFLRAPAPEKKDGFNHYFVEETVGATESASYRLKRIVGKNKFEYTEPVEVKCQKKSSKDLTVDVFPSGYGAFRIVVNAPAEDLFKVTLFDAAETEIQSKDFVAAPGSNEFMLESATVTKGNYTLRITNGSTTKVKKIILK
jgi:hypothetical protein